MELRLVDDGEAVALHLKEPGTDRPIAGLKMVLGTGDEALSLTSDETGRIAFPVSSRLLAANPKVKIIKPTGVDRYAFSLNLSVDCHELGSPPKKIDVSAVGNWQVTQSEPDRVYAEAARVTEEQQRTMASLLAEERLALQELTGKAPPPIAVALLASDAKIVRGSSDAEGRHVWPIRQNELANDERIISTLVHEWTHRILAVNFGFVGDDESRFVEDGLCELIAHQVYVRVRGGKSSPTVISRAQELDRFSKQQPATINLKRLSKVHDFSRYPTLIDALVGMCREDTAFGYDLGLALWLEKSEKEPSFISDVFKRLQKSTNKRQSLMDEFAGKVDALEVKEALTVLKRHAGN